MLDVADAGEAAAGDFAIIGVDDPGEGAEEGGFAGAVGADEADAVALVDLELDIAKERGGPEGLGESLSVQ